MRFFPLRRGLGALLGLSGVLRCGAHRALGRLLSLLLLYLLAAAPAHAVAPLLLAQGQEAGRPVTLFAELLEDRDGKLDLEGARAASGWRPGPAGALLFGFSRSSYWLRWQVANSSSEPLGLVLDLGSPRQDHVDWHVLRDGGERITSVRSGDRLPFAQRPIPSRNFALPLSLAPHEHIELYMRLASHDGLYEAMPVALYTRLSFFAATDAESLALTLYHGGLLALVLYNLLLFAATRQRVFGLYVGYMLSLLLWSFSARGYAFQYLWPESTVFNNNVLAVSAAWAFAIFGFFTIEYLRLRECAPRWLLRLNQSLAWVNMAVLLPALADWHALSAAIGLITGVAMAAVALGTGIWLLLRGQRQARFFVLAFTLLGVGASAYMLQVAALVPVNAFTNWGLLVGSAFEGLVLALGLADAMNILKAQMLTAERAAREAQQALATRLEQQVQERTQALEQANQRLLTLSVTDELTGAYNRRHFNEFCRAALSRRQRREPLAFCMFDLDYFKRYNDRHGHQAGDAALRAVAAAIQAELKRSGDVLFRLGGEEFGLLFDAPSTEAALAFVQRLREVVLALQIPHHDSPAGQVTASFGLGCWSAEAALALTPERMMAVADLALYEAKAAGRDGVALHAEAATA